MSSTRDPYLVLGISRSASADEVKKAYRDMAKKHHPDRNPDDKKAEAKLKEINGAYTLLSDAEKRRRYDAGEIDADGNEKIFSYKPQGGGGFRSSGGRGHGARNFFTEDDFSSEDIINSLFGGGRKKARASSGFGSGFAGMGMGGESGDRPEPSSSRDINYNLKLPFVEATLGGKRTVKLSGGKELNLSVPPGTTDGTKLRLKGQGMPGRGHQPAGDAYIVIQVEPDKFFRREGNDLHCEVPVGLNEAVLGASIRVPTLSGLVEVKVPKGSNTGTVLRLKGKGVPLNPPGDQYVRLKIVLPDQPDEGLMSFLKNWAAASGFNPRKKAGLE